MNAPATFNVHTHSPAGYRDWCAANDERAREALEQAGIWYGPHSSRPDFAINKEIEWYLGECARVEIEIRRLKEDIHFLIGEITRRASEQSWDTITRLVVQASGIKWEAITGPRRERCIIPARMSYMWLLRKHCKHLSMPTIGRRCGGRDHSTVIHACKKVDRIMADEVNDETSAEIRRIVAYVEARL